MLWMWFCGKDVQSVIRILSFKAILTFKCWLLLWTRKLPEKVKGTEMESISPVLFFHFLRFAQNKQDIDKHSVTDICQE